jgi:hypothetical protein
MLSEPLPSNYSGGRDFMMYAVEMGSGAMMYIASFVRDSNGDGVGKVYSQMHRQRDDPVR